jgi:hypothetical protein
MRAYGRTLVPPREDQPERDERHEQDEDPADLDHSRSVTALEWRAATPTISAAAARVVATLSAVADRWPGRAGGGPLPDRDRLCARRRSIAPSDSRRARTSTAANAN